jgi:hypothetical protein
MNFRKDMKKRKLEYARHVLRGLSGKTHITLLEGKVCGKTARGRPRRTWINDIIDWTKLIHMKTETEQLKYEEDAYHSSQPSIRR